MKEELNRYYLIEYQDSRDTIIESNEEYYKIVASAKKNNKNEKNNILIGNIERYTDRRGRLHVVEHMYNKLAPKSTISGILDVTTKYSEKDFKKKLASEGKLKYSEEKGFYPDIYIVYKEEKNKNEVDDKNYDVRFKCLPMMYKDDLKYLDLNTIYNMISNFAHQYDYGFFKELANNVRKSLREKTSLLFERVNDAQSKEYNKDLLDIAMKSVYQTARELVYEYTVDREKGTIARDNSGNVLYSKRRILDIGNVIKYYKCLPGTRISAVSRNTTITSKKNRENQAKERELEELRIESLLNDVPKEEQIKKLREEKERFEAFKAAYEEVRQKSYDVEEDYQQRLF